MMQTQLVKKTAIIESGDFNLSAARYLEKVEINSDFEQVYISEICSIVKIKSQSDSYPYLEIGDIDILTKKYSFKSKKSVNGALTAFKNNIIISRVRPTRGAISIINEDSVAVSSGFCILDCDNSKVSSMFLMFYLINNRSFFEYLGNVSQGASYPTCKNEDILSFKISLPPLEIQEQIVNEVEGYQQIIDGCRQVVENYKPVIDIDPSWDIKEVNELGEIISGGTPKSTESSYWNGDIKWLTLVDLPANEHVTYIKDSKRKITELGLKKSSAKLIAERSVIISTRATIGRIGINMDTVATNQGFKSIVINNESLIPEFIAFQFLSKKDDLINLASGGTFKEISTKNFKTIKFSIPSIETQKEIVTKLEQEREVIEGNKELIKIYEDKINARINKVWSDN